MVVTLALMRLVWKVDGRLEEPHLYEYSKMLSMLNWIATCFVTDPVGDGVATALSTEEDQIILYIATHRGQPRPDDKAYGAHFIQLLRETITQTNVSSTTNQLVATLAPRLYTRFARKVDMIRKMDEPSEPVEVQFNRIVDQWAADNNMEDWTFFLTESLHLGSVEHENGNQRLKSVFNAIVSMARADAKSDLPQDEQTRRSRVFTFALSAFTLLKSRFFTRIDGYEKESILRGSKEFIWILRLRRRLWRLASYYKDAWTFAETAFPFFRRILKPDGIATFQQGGSGIKIVWIGDQPGVLPNPHPDTVVIKQSPETLLNELFIKFEEEDEPLPVIPPETKKDLENLWHEDIAIDICLHCELQMIAYLEANHIQIQGDSIGSSKLMCWACDAYVEKVNANRKRNGEDRWVLSGTSHKLDPRWLIPPTPIGEDVASDLRSRLRSSIEWLAAILHRQHWRASQTETVLSFENFTISDSVRDIMHDLFEQ